MFYHDAASSPVYLVGGQPVSSVGTIVQGEGRGVPRLKEGDVRRGGVKCYPCSRCLLGFAFAHINA